MFVPCAYWQSLTVLTVAVQVRRLAAEGARLPLKGTSLERHLKGIHL